MARIQIDDYQRLRAPQDLVPGIVGEKLELLVANMPAMARRDFDRCYALSFDTAFSALLQGDEHGHVGVEFFCEEKRSEGYLQLGFVGFNLVVMYAGFLGQLCRSESLQDEGTEVIRNTARGVFSYAQWNRPLPLQRQ